MNDPRDTNGEEITLQMVMSHMQHGFNSLKKEIRRVDVKIDNLENKVDAGFADLRDRWRWLESHDLPRRVSRLEDKVFAGFDA